jgi:hypothetical protein
MENFKFQISDLRFQIWDLGFWIGDLGLELRMRFQFAMKDEEEDAS